MSEIFAGRNFRESAHSQNFLHFAGIYFCESSCLKNFAGINSRELRGTNSLICAFFVFFYFNLSQITQEILSVDQKIFFAGI